MGGHGFYSWTGRAARIGESRHLSETAALTLRLASQSVPDGVHGIQLLVEVVIYTWELYRPHFGKFVVQAM